MAWPDELRRAMEDNRLNHRYEVLGIKLSPREDDGRVYGAIWFDRECGKNDILWKPKVEGESDGQTILILDDGDPQGPGFRFLFGVTEPGEAKWVEDLQIGDMFQLIGSVIGKASEGRGGIEFPNPGESPGASLGFFSEFGYDKDGGLIKLP